MIDWICGNKSFFYDATRISVQPILNKIDSLMSRYLSNVSENLCFTTYLNFCPSLKEPVNVGSFLDNLENIYAEFISELNVAAENNMPLKTKKNVKKFWWDQELNVLKT